MAQYLNKFNALYKRAKTNLPRYFVVLVSLGMVMCVSACGQKGALYLPPSEPSDTHLSQQAQNVSEVTDVKQQVTKSDDNGQLTNKDDY